jgi:hypothetical protein
VADFCTYHPSKRACCYCEKCGSYYCSDCAKRTRETYGKARAFFFCLKCNIPAEMLTVGSFIDPFWKRLPKFFAYPFQLRPLGFILILPLIAVILIDIPLVTFFLSVIQLKYCFDILNNTANGCLKAPEVSYSFELDDIGMVFKQYAIIVVSGIVTGVIFKELGVVPGTLCAGLLVLLMPAMIIGLAISKNLSAALNPISSITLATRIGGSYLLMCLFLLLLLFAPGYVLSYVGQAMAERLRLFVSNAATLYYMVISYNLMGYVILQYHEAIGYEVGIDDFVEQGEAFKDEDSPPPKERETAESIISRAETLIKAGRTDDALWVMDNWLRTKGPDKALSERYYNLLKITRKGPEMLSYAQKHLDLLAAAGEKDATCAVYKECISSDPEFTPNPEVLFKVGQWQIDTGDPRSGAETLVRFLKANKEHGLVPNAYFSLARCFHEKLNNSIRAEQILKSIIQKFPHHDLAVHAQRYHGEMTKVKVQAG